MTGQYDGMYCRTVGAVVPLLLETKNYEKAELLLKFVFKAMKLYGMNRVPHVIGKTTSFNGKKDSLYIIGKTDQIDGQAHNILAWAKLALARGDTPFEDSTWNLVSGLMDRSTEEPYMGSKKKSFIPGLVYNFNFEHSRALPTNYDLLTQCFIGAALESMIKVAQRRNDSLHIKHWNEKLKTLKSGIEKYMTRVVDGKKIYLELLAKEGNENKKFLGFSWVNLSPAAAQWEPLKRDVFKNTVMEMQNQTLQKWNNIKWMPTESWPGGEFSGQMIGKGIGWEIEFCREEKDWKRLLEILSMLEVVQHDESIFMENSFLTAGSQNSVQRMNKNDLEKMQYGIWKIVDPGNGEQAAWWCWAMARLRKEFGLSALPEKLCSEPEIKISLKDQTKAYIEISNQNNASIFYTLNGTVPSKNSIPYNGNYPINKPAKIRAVAYNNNLMVSDISNLVVPSVYNGLEYLCFPDIKENDNFEWTENSPSYTGYMKNFNLKDFSVLENKFGIIQKGFLKINREGDYKFFIIALNHSRLYIDGQLISYDINSLKNNDSIKKNHFKKGLHKLKLESECSPRNNNIDIYYSINYESKEIVDPSMLLTKLPGDSTILPPKILPFKPEFDIDEKLLVTIKPFDSSEIFYTLDASNPSANSFKYKKPIEVNSSMTVKAVSMRNGQASSISIMDYKQTEKTKVKLKFQPGSKYKAMGTASLIDGIYGSTNLNDCNWLGFEGDDFDVTLDLRKIKSVKEIKTGFLNNPGSWIFLPQEIKFFVSANGEKF